MEDHYLCGYPQIIIQLKGQIHPIIVTYDSSWEDYLPSISSTSENPALKNVVLALETQLKNLSLSLLQSSHQILLRKCMLNRSLTILRNSILSQASFNIAVSDKLPLQMHILPI